MRLKIFELPALFILFLATAAQAAIVVDVYDHDTLQKLDQPGAYSLSTVLANPNAFESIFTVIRQDVDEIKKRAGVGMAFSAEQAERLAPKGNIARHFDPYWLSSKMASFPLIAVINRVDKKDFYPDTCGEVRFIYRLAYKRERLEARSTLPFFLNVVFEYPKRGNDNCASVARQWDFATGQPDADRLINGPLNFAGNSLRLKQVELNMQVVRFPSGLETEFGGQAIYLFRIFQLWNGAWNSVPLENTVDVSALKDESLLRDLVRQLRDPENLRKIDEGTFILENSQQRLLARRALSFSTNGRARLGNRPFTAVLGPKGEKLGNVDLAGLKFINSKAGLVERLNNFTCVGCHQAGGTAGFHVLGLGGHLNSAFNQVILPFSPHYSAERNRRATAVARVAQDQSADAFRPLSFMPGLGRADDRDLCLPDSTDFKLINKCRTGTSCKLTVRNAGLGVQIGECVHDSQQVAGHVCRYGVIQSSPGDTSLGDLVNLKSYKDKIDINSTIYGGACGHPKGGVPLGRISKVCDLNSAEGRLEWVDKLNAYEGVPKEICAMRGGPQFDECARAANPAECLARAPIVRALLDACYPGRFCREDYICQQLPAAISRDYPSARRGAITARVEKLGRMSIGFCVPNYFIFNMRTDGHILPEGR